MSLPSLPPNPTIQQIEHFVQAFSASVQKSAGETLPRHFDLEVDQLDGTALVFRMHVIASCSEGTSWEAMRVTFHTAAIVNPQYKELRVKMQGDHVFLCGVECLGRKGVDHAG